MNLYDLLACPACKGELEHTDALLGCPACGRSYPIVGGVPVLLPDGSIPQTLYQHELDVRSQYDPWIHRVVLQSLPAGAAVLDLGAGNMALDLPHVIRMDVTITPYVDVVGDAHALPFRPGALDFIFSLAVIEHLRQPFHAAQEMHRALRPGGYVYGECNFVFAYHGYPHHYFNASQQGLEQVFQTFTRLRSGVAPYQMPAFALRAILQTYLHDLAATDPPGLSELQVLLQNVLDQPLSTYDSNLSEAQALRTAAGVFFFGYKPGPSEVIPARLQGLWHATPALQRRFPELYDLGHAENMLRWARTEGRSAHPELEGLLARSEPFQKGPSVSERDLAAFEAWPVIDPRYGAIPDAARAASLPERITQLEATIAEKNAHIATLERLLQKIESGRVMRLLRRLRGL
jgi:uncharacterized protein YbaR (Trm112 family)/SAM-dependent methyltransferase